MTNSTTTTTDYSISVTVAAPAEQLRSAIARVEDWWTTDLERDGDEFTAHFGRNWTRVRVDGDRWTVTAQDTPAIPVPDEWVGDQLTFAAEEAGADTSVLRFTHHGLLAQECSSECRPAWRHFIDSIVTLAETGEGNPQRPAASEAAA
jgi:hypothetical protein